METYTRSIGFQINVILKWKVSFPRVPLIYYVITFFKSTATGTTLVPIKVARTYLCTCNGFTSFQSVTCLKNSFWCFHSNRMRSKLYYRKRMFHFLPRMIRLSATVHLAGFNHFSFCRSKKIESSSLQNFLTLKPY